jgi:UDP-N-acetylmuramoyl-tripeptide--D-alanyl-D-alanine ligase
VSGASFDVAAILAATGGALRQGGAGAARGVSTDSRSVAAGELFVALAGPREQPVRIVLDGHRFAAEALGRGAWGVLVDAARLADGALAAELAAFADRAVIAVPDTLAALGDLAAWHRRRMPARVVGITGSNGKTTTKEMASAIAAARWRTLANEGNRNNLVGLPLALLGLDASHEVAVAEMGMSRPGEIRRLAAIAAPDVAVVTNVGPVHLEGVGSLAGVAAAKAEILEALGSGGTAVLNADDPQTPAVAAGWRGATVRFGLGAGADCRAEGIAADDDGGTAFTLVLPGGERGPVRIAWLGEHNVRNALAAAGAAHRLGADLAQVRAGLAAARPAAMRFEVRAFAPDVTVVNDAYNANPASMRAALAALAQLPGRRRRVLVLGDMLELGASAAEEHRLLGAAAAAAAPALLVAVGALAAETAAGARAAGLAPSAVATAADADAAAALVAPALRAGDLLLLKGSRGVRLERVLERLVAAGALRAAAPGAADAPGAGRRAG